MTTLRDTRLTQREGKETFSIYLRSTLVAKLADYEDIGSVEELRELKEKATPKKPKLIRVAKDCEYMTCLHCKLKTVLYEFMRPWWCPNCGGRLDWNKEKEG